jgi:hypothetical protein
MDDKNSDRWPIYGVPCAGGVAGLGQDVRAASWPERPYAYTYLLTRITFTVCAMAMQIRGIAAE